MAPKRGNREHFKEINPLECVCVCVCVCVFVCVVIPFILDVRLVEVPAGVTRCENCSGEMVKIGMIK